MHILIVEDEKIAAEKLKILLKKIAGNIEIAGVSASVEESIKVIESNKDIDLGFFDIQLADGLSFLIFEKIKVNFPVIFTTAYNQYAIQAFKHNSIDYLLKPIQIQDLRNAINKYETLWKPGGLNSNLLHELKALVNNKYKERFVVKVGEHIKMVNTEDICCFYSFDKGTFLLNYAGNNYLLDYSLDALQNLLSPKQFFRVNRQYTINITSIRDIVNYSNSRLKLKLACPGKNEIIVSREKVRDFKQWIDR